MTRLSPLPPEEMPARWREPLRSALAGSERLLATIEVDLDDRLRYADGLLALTSRRLLWWRTDGGDQARGSAAGPASAEAPSAQWSCSDGISLVHFDHG